MTPSLMQQQRLLIYESHLPPSAWTIDSAWTYYTKCMLHFVMRPQPHCCTESLELSGFNQPFCSQVWPIGLAVNCKISYHHSKSHGGIILVAAAFKRWSLTWLFVQWMYTLQLSLVVVCVDLQGPWKNRVRVDDLQQAFLTTFCSSEIVSTGVVLSMQAYFLASYSINIVVNLWYFVENREGIVGEPHTSNKRTFAVSIE